MSRAMSKSSGFTLIELMIATLVSAALLVVIASAILQFSRQYYKGVISTKTQTTARAIMDDVTRSIEFNQGEVSELKTTTSSPPAATDPVVGYCIGTSKRYSFSQNFVVTDTKHGFISDTVSGCNGLTAALNPSSLTNLTGADPVTSRPLANARELLETNMRVTKFSINHEGNLYTISLRLVYGDDDVLEGTPLDTCKTQVGSEYCATSELTTTVQKRVN